MRKMLTISLLFFSLISNAQKIRFEYDQAGNQTLRTYCTDCSSRMSNEPIKEISDLQNSDLQKFFPDDVISYYPNPVKDELYLRWQLVNNNKVARIEINSMSGQSIKIIKGLENKNDQIVSFQDYTEGIYFVNLVYINGEQKSIKIIKNK